MSITADTIQEQKAQAPLDIQLVTFVDTYDAEYIVGYCHENGVTVADFLREAAIDAASR